MSDPSPGTTVAPAGGGSELLDGQDPASTSPTPRRPKASKEEMQRREVQVLEILTERGALDVYTLSGILDLSYSQTVTLVTRMVQAGQIRPSGKKQKKTMYSPRVRPAPIVSSEQVTVLPPMAVADLVAGLHLGTSLEVIGLHQKNDETCLDLRTDGREFSVLLLTAAA